MSRPTPPHTRLPNVTNHIISDLQIPAHLSTWILPCPHSPHPPHLTLPRLAFSPAPFRVPRIRTYPFAMCMTDTHTAYRHRCLLVTRFIRFTDTPDRLSLSLPTESSDAHVNHTSLRPIPPSHLIPIPSSRPHR